MCSKILNWPGTGNMIRQLWDRFTINAGLKGFKVHHNCKQRKQFSLFPTAACRAPAPARSFHTLPAHTVPCTVCAVYVVNCTLYTVHCILYTVYCTLYTAYVVHCTQFTLCSFTKQIVPCSCLTLFTSREYIHQKMFPLVSIVSWSLLEHAEASTRLVNRRVSNYQD